MRILLVSPYDLTHPGGVTSHVFDLAHAQGGLTGAVHPYGTSRGNVAVAIKADVERQEWQGKVRPWGLGHSVNMSFRRETYAWIGGFDEEMGPGTDLYAAEDLDILYRVLGAGGSLSAKVATRPTCVCRTGWTSTSCARSGQP